MIVPMKHLTLLCVAGDKPDALKYIAQLGAVHVTTQITDSSIIHEANQKLAAVERALRVLDVVDSNGILTFKPEASSPVASMDFATLVQNAQTLTPQTVADVNIAAELCTRLAEESQRIRAELQRYALFGSITPARLTQLAAEGIAVTLVRFPIKSMGDIDFDSFMACGTDATYAYGAWIGDAVPEVAEVLPPPSMSTRDAEQCLETARLSQERLVAQLKSQSASLRQMSQAQVVQSRDAVTWSKVSENMLLADAVAYVTGYIPARAVTKLEALVARYSWGVVLRDPEPGEQVPVLLEPPRCFRSITALFQGLGILPAYDETDISVAFYAFFTIFFAMLVGDAGYGALILGGVLWAWFKLRAKTALRPVFTIFTVFSVATIGWGILSGTYFGIPQDVLPAWMKFKTVAWIGVQSNIMFLCFILGATHLSLARIWNAVQLAPDSRALGECGWACIIWAMFNVVCGIVVTGYQQPSWTWYLLGAGVAMVLLFMYKPSELKEHSIDLAMLPLNVISSMGDIISYVRLFAVGMAAVKLAENFNQMATGLDLPMAVKIPAMLLILLLGHGLNLVMGALSILVHAVRLNTLEFSNAKGISWSGVPYKPFRQPDCQQVD